MQLRFTFEELEKAPLIVGAIYQSKESSDIKYEPISTLFKGLGIGNMGGYRPKTKAIPPFAILYTTGKEKEWPDIFIPETGVMEYFGDNRSPEKDLLDTPLNSMLTKCFELLEGSEEERKKVPPFLIFKKVGEKYRHVQFLGLAVPGMKDVNPSKCLRLITDIKDNKSYQNYLIYLTVVNVREISWDWLQALKNDPNNHMKLAPKQWLDFVKYGQNGIEPLKAILELDARNSYLQYFAETIVPENLKEGINELINTDDGWSIFEDLNLEKLLQEQTEKVVKLFKRNLTLAKSLKELYEGKCQICGFTFKKENGENYSECHHLIPLGENGSDSLDNIIIVCANCHRMLHYARIEFRNIEENTRVFLINNEESTITYLPKHFKI